MGGAARDSHAQKARRSAIFCDILTGLCGLDAITLGDPTQFASPDMVYICRVETNTGEIVLLARSYHLCSRVPATLGLLNANWQFLDFMISVERKGTFCCDISKSVQEAFRLRLLPC